MKKNYFSFLTAILAFGVQSIFAQNTVTHQVIICSGGDFGNPEDFVTVASYSIASGQTIVFDTIYTQSVQNVIIENEFAFVAAQDSIVKYDLDTYERIAAVEASGIHKLAVRDSILVASFWYPETSGFVKTYLSSDLSPVVIFDEVSGEADGIFIFPGGLRTVVAVPGGWGSTIGKLAWFDMETSTFYAEGDMGGYGNGVSFFATFDTGIPNYVAVTKTPWGDSTFNVYGFTANGEATGVYSYNATMQGYTGQENTIMYAQFNDGIGQLDLENHTIDNNLMIDPPALTIASSVYDSVNKHFYVATTDYFSTGVGEIYNINGQIIGNFDAGISPEAIAIDYRNNTGIGNLQSVNKIKIYPNPSSAVITVEVPEGLYSDYFKVADISGRIIINESIRINNRTASIDISMLENGLYFLILFNNNEVLTSPFVKK